MAAAKQKIVLNSSRDIPFNKLVLSQSNVRRTKAGVSIEELAEDIARRGLLQSLHVRPVRDADGAETGMYEVPAGGRRYRALERLVKQKRLLKTQLVPCVVKDDGIAEEDSLAENVQRVALHPLDQFRAFHDLREKGLSEEEIAARFFVTPTVVKQRLRLASVSPKLLEIYGEDGMTLEQLMAFSVTSDRVRQEQVWDSVKNSYSNEPFHIRRLVTQNTVPSTDKRAAFIGLEAYEEADGYVLRDLFSERGEGYLQDVVLLDRLVAEKLKAEAEKIAAEGWKWIEVSVDFPFGHADDMGRIDGYVPDLTEEEKATIAALEAEFERLEAQYAEDDEYPEDVDRRLGEIETALDAFENRPAIYDPADIARAGVFISIDRDGKLDVDCGYVRLEDEIAAVESAEGDPGEAESGGDEEAVPASRRTIITIGGKEAADEDDEDEEDAVKPLPDRLISELTAHRTLALRDAVAGNPHVALTLLLHRLCVDAFHEGFGGKCLQAFVQKVSLQNQAPDLKESASAQSIKERHEAWKADMPANEGALWDWIADLDDDSRGALLAYCVSAGVNALQEKGDRYGAGPSAHAVHLRIEQADRLARAVGLDMVEAGWRPTVENYLGRVPKTRILEAVSEAKGEAAAQLIDHLKKGDMAKEAERLLDGAGWLPEPLRLDDDSAAIEALPDFLAGGDEEREADAKADRAAAAA
mgnify:CR=1 FL=1